MFIIEWWNELGLALQIFYCVAIPASLVLIIQTVMMFVGMGNDGDASDADGVGEAPDSIEADVPDDVGDGVFGEDSVSDVVDSAGLEGLRIFTVRGIVAFFVMFGWVGVAMLEAGAHLALTIPVAVVCGFAMMVAIAFLFRAAMKLRSNGNTDNRNAIGTSGKVYLTVPPARSGSGKVQIMLQGSLVEREAVTDETEEIPTGTEIVVVGVSGQVELLVKRK